MSMKNFLAVLSTILFIVSTGIGYAGQNGGVASGTGPSLPGGIQSSINPQGLGDSLLFGYYNVRGYLDLINVINTNQTDGAKARIVFRNAKTGVDCFEFTVCLSEGDVWTGYLIDNGTTAALCPFDTDTLTSPTIPATCQQFKYEGAGGKDGVAADDCREGYFEVVGMVNIPGYNRNVTSPLLETEADCRDYATGADLPNVLRGNNTIVTLNNLETFSYDAIAVADTRLSPLPTTDVIDAGGIPAAMDKGCPEADYIFMKSKITSPFNLLYVLGGETEVIVTFPTRLACHNTPSDTMFNAHQDEITGKWGFYTTYQDLIWDDKGHIQDRRSYGFVPVELMYLPFAANTIKIGPSFIWKSTTSVVSSNFDFGWLIMDFVAGEPGRTMRYGANPSRTSSGLPAVGYTVQSFMAGGASYMIPASSETAIQ